MQVAQPVRLVVAALLFLLSPLLAAAPQNRVVFHLSEAEPSTWRQAFNNARNVQKVFGKGNIAIAVVIQGNAIGAARTDSPVADNIAESIASGMEIIVCENTLRERHLKREDINRNVRFTPFGVVELMKKQQEGWAYIKP
jgi:hypothetical protein